LIRHGSRAPDTPNMKCWGNSTTSFSEYLSCQRFNVEKLPSLQDTASNMVYNKKYVTLATVTHTSHNKKHQWSCKSGLLFDYSYNELKSIGIHMQDAYITTNEGNLKLFDSTKYKDRPYNNSTLFFLTGFGYMSLSLQMILYGMFDIARSTVVDVIVHSMDKKNDYDVKRVLERAAHGKSKKIQSKLRERAIRERYMKSNPSLKKQLQPFERLNALQKRDCLLTTICNDGKLPTGLDDYINDQDDSLFGKMVRHSTWEYEHKYVYNDAAYAKWKVRPIVEQMVEGLATDATEDLVEGGKPRLSIYLSGAEYIASFLAVLCGTIIDSMGIPQSSQLLIEHHYIHDNQRHAFRLLWNGKVITDRVAGCELSSDLCDLDVLFHHFERTETIPKSNT